MQKRCIQLLIIFQLVFVSKNFSQSIASVKTDSQPVSGISADESSVDKGFSFQKMTTAQISSIASPATGLIIYNSSLNAFQINTGTGSKPLWSTLGATVGNWLTAGNSVAAADEKLADAADNPATHFRTNN